MTLPFYRPRGGVNLHGAATILPFRFFPILPSSSITPLFSANLLWLSWQNAGGTSLESIRCGFDTTRISSGRPGLNQSDVCVPRHTPLRAHDGGAEEEAAFPHARAAAGRFYARRRRAGGEGTRAHLHTLHTPPWDMAHCPLFFMRLCLSSMPHLCLPHTQHTICLSYLLYTAENSQTGGS